MPRRRFPSQAAVWFVELLIDWVKHSFITKFNRLQAHVYTKFHRILSHDLIVTRTKMKVVLDPTHAITRRLGLASLPLTCVVSSTLARDRIIARDL